MDTEKLEEYFKTAAAAYAEGKEVGVAADIEADPSKLKYWSFLLGTETAKMMIIQWAKPGDAEAYQKAANNRTVVCFDNGTMCFYNDDWPVAEVTGVFILPELPK